VALEALVSTVSFLVPTIGRPTLARTLASIELQAGDEIVLVGDESLEANLQQFLGPQVRFLACPPGKDWGAAERNFAQPKASSQYIAHIDDDDYYAPGTRQLMADAMLQTPDRPVLFRMQYPNGLVLWQGAILRCGNVGTPMMLIPNDPQMFGTWGSFVGGDCHFLETMKWTADQIVWRPEVIALLGHNV